MLAVRWYLRYGLSYRDLEELLAERGIEVDHVTLYRWVQRFTPLLIEAARPCRHVVGDRWFGPMSLVVKPTRASGRGLVKLSDNPAKATGAPKDVERYKIAAGYGEHVAVAPKY